MRGVTFDQAAELTRATYGAVDRAVIEIEPDGDGARLVIHVESSATLDELSFCPRLRDPSRARARALRGAAHFRCQCCSSNPRTLRTFTAWPPELRSPIQPAGGQESGLRGGTENLAGAVAMAGAAEIVLSDLAATAARPRAVLISLCAPAERPQAWLQKLLRAAGERAHDFGAELVGGDLCAADGPVCISVTGVGAPVA